MVEQNNSRVITLGEVAQREAQSVIPYLMDGLDIVETGRVLVSEGAIQKLVPESDSILSWPELVAPELTAFGLYVIGPIATILSKLSAKQTGYSERMKKRAKFNREVRKGARRVTIFDAQGIVPSPTGR